jgi:hypothetical protein
VTGGQPAAGQVTAGQIITGRTPPQAPATPAALPPADAGESSAVIEKKRQSCLQVGAGRGVPAPEMADFVAVCVGEARLACLKQALAQRVHGPERQDFLNRCLQGS